jgi:hypothetical protein
MLLSDAPLATSEKRRHERGFQLPTGSESDFQEAAKQVGALIDQMTQHQYRRYNTILMWASGISTGMDVRRSDTPLHIMWADLIRDILILQQEIYENPPDADTSAYSSSLCRLRGPNDKPIEENGETQPALPIVTFPTLTPGFTHTEAF